MTETGLTAPAHPSRRYLVIGAAYAGTRAALELRRNDPSAQVVLIDDDPDAHYDRTEVSKAVLAGTAPQPRNLCSTADLTAARVLNVRATAVELHLDRRVVTDNTGVEHPFDRLVIATGREPVNPWPDLPVHTVYSARDARRLSPLLSTGRSVVVVGAGLVGLEVASAAAGRGCTVTVVDAAHSVAAGHLPRPVADVVIAAHRSAGVHLLLGATVEIGTGPDGRIAVSTAAGSVLTAEVVVVAVGTRPRVEWLRRSGLRVGRGLWCDATLTTSHPDVLVAGDAAEPAGEALGLSVGHVTAAMDSGRAAALNAMREPGERQTVSTTGFFWTDFHHHRLQVVGTPGHGDEFVWDDEPRVGLSTRHGTCTAVWIFDGAQSVRDARSRLAGPFARQPNEASPASLTTTAAEAS